MRIEYTDHALIRMRQRDITEEEVRIYLKIPTRTQATSPK